MQGLLQAGLLGHGADLVVFVRRALDLVDRRHAVGHLAAEIGGAHLRHADLLRPLDLFRLIGPERVHLKVRADALHAVVVQDLPRQLPVGEVLVLVVGRVAQLDDLDADPLHVLEQPGELAGHDPRAMGIRLAPDRQAERIGPKLHAARGEEPDDSRVGAGLWKNSRL